MLQINDLKRHNSAIELEIRDAVSRVIDSGWYVMGPEVLKFEEEYAAYLGCTFAVGVGNGTDALEIALRALDIGAGDHVATVANAGMYSTTAILAVGATPFYVDVDVATMTMDPAALRETLKDGDVKAIIATHLYGQMANMSQICSIAASNNTPVIEDCAQAHGARSLGRSAGTWGDIGCFSFYPTKNLGALGDGGALVTSNETHAVKIKQLRQYGWTQKYHVGIPGGRNSRLDEIQAAVLRVKLRYLDLWNSSRRSIAKCYSEGLVDLGIVLPGNFSEDYVAHLYVLRFPGRDQLKHDLRSKGIGTDIHYPILDYSQLVCANDFNGFNLPLSKMLNEDILTIPCFPEMKEEEIKYVIENIRTFITN